MSSWEGHLEGILWIHDLTVSLVQDRMSTTVVSMGSEQDIGRWERLDDIIMGGQSSSTLTATEDGAALFSGDLILEGGGFCGARTKVSSFLTDNFNVSCPAGTFGLAGSSGVPFSTWIKESSWRPSFNVRQLPHLCWQRSGMRRAHRRLVQGKRGDPVQGVRAGHRSGSQRL